MRGEVKECFHPGIESSEAREFLLRVDTKGLLGPERAEIEVLGRLKDVKNEEDLRRAFDALWNGQGAIVELIKEKRYPRDYIFSLSELYYIMSSYPASTWQAEEAEEIYKSLLKKVSPGELSGYALHFFTISLLRTGRFDEAIGCLGRLSSLKEPRFFLEDLEFAKGMVEKWRDTDSMKSLHEFSAGYCKGLTAGSSRIYVKMCRETAAHIGEAARALQKRQKGGRPGIVVVVKLMTKEDGAFHAGEDGRPDLSGAKLVFIKDVHLDVGKKRVLNLPRFLRLTLRLMGMWDERARIKVDLKRGENRLFHSLLITHDQGSIIIGGEKGEGGRFTFLVMESLF